MSKTTPTEQAAIDLFNEMKDLQAGLDFYLPVRSGQGPLDDAELVKDRQRFVRESIVRCYRLTAPLRTLDGADTGNANAVTHVIRAILARLGDKINAPSGQDADNEFQEELRQFRYARSLVASIRYDLSNGARGGLEDGDGEWSLPMSKTDMRTRLCNMPHRKFNTFAKRHGIKPAGNRQLFQIRLDTMDTRTRKRLEN